MKPAFLTERAFTGHKMNNRASNDLGLIYMGARFYVPSIGLFASADTLVPDPTNPQQYNRYTYTLNNPLRYSDPTGHFSEEVIYEYLLNHECGGSPICADDTMESWSHNKDWWDQLLNAQAGDILIYTDTPHMLLYLTFTGEGRERLDGACFSDANGRRRLGFHDGDTLNDFFADAIWVPGSIRWQNNRPVFQLNTGWDIKTWQKPGWQRTLEDVAWDATGGIVVATLCPKCSLGLTLLGGAAFEAFSLPEWWRDNVSMTSENNLRVTFLRTYAHGYWTLGRMNFLMEVSSGGNWIYQDVVNGGWQYE